MSWPTIALGDAVTFKGGGTPSRDNPAYWGGRISWATVKDFNSGAVLRSTQESITEDGLRSSASNLIPAGTVIIPTRMALGKAVISEADVAINQDLKAVFPRSNVEPRFLLWYFIANRSRIEAMGKGATVKGVTLDQLRKLELPLPPRSEQRRIAAILDKADALSAKRREAIAKLDQLLQSVFLELFGDPVANPKGWVFQTLGSLVARKTNNGAYYPAEQYLSSGGVPMVHMSDAFYGVVKRVSLKRVDAPSRDVKKYGITKNDILVSRRSLTYAGSAKPCLVEDIGEPLIYESSLIRVTVDPNKMTPLYLFHYLSNSRARSKYVFKHVTSATISGINQAGLNAVAVMVPSMDIQLRFGEICLQISQSRKRLEKQADVIDGLLSSTQFSAFAGPMREL